MSSWHKTVAGMTIFCAFATAAAGQDLMAPPMTPPILTQQPPAQSLIVPPQPVQPANPAPVGQPASEPADQAPASTDEAGPPGGIEPALQAGDITTTTEQFEDWGVECFDPKLEGLACQAIHRVTAGDASQVVMVLAVTAKSGTPAAIQAALPLGISLDAAVQIVIGEGYQNKIPVSRCTPSGCLIEGQATEEFLAALRAGTSGTVVVETETGEKIRLPFSLLGFTKAFEKVLSANG